MDILQQIIFPALDEARATIESAARLERSPDSKLFGGGALDSMGLVRFIVLVEERIADLTKIELTLVSDKAMSRNSSPFRTLQTLADYVEECLVERGFRG
jgi:acyl carrier protein